MPAPNGIAESILAVNAHIVLKKTVKAEILKAAFAFGLQNSVLMAARKQGISAGGADGVIGGAGKRSRFMHHVNRNDTVRHKTILLSFLLMIIILEKKMKNKQRGRVWYNMNKDRGAKREKFYTRFLDNERWMCYTVENQFFKTIQRDRQD